MIISRCCVRRRIIQASTIEEAAVDNPRISRLLAAKAELLESRPLPPFYLDADLRTLDLAALECRFDVIHIDPPWQEYVTRAATGGHQGASADMPCVWSFEDIARLNIEAIGMRHEEPMRVRVRSEL